MIILRNELDSLVKELNEQKVGKKYYLSFYITAYNTKPYSLKVKGNLKSEIYDRMDAWEMYKYLKELILCGK